jgi:heme O synthase-like polyprenyltransferase
VLLHSATTAAAGLALALSPSLGWVYFAIALVAGIDLLRKNLKLLYQPDPANARTHFMASNHYLMFLLLAIFVDVAL